MSGGTVVSWRNDAGEWEELGYVDGPIETKPLGCWNYGYPLPDWHGDEVRHTLTEFSGTLTFDVAPDQRQALLVFALNWQARVQAEATRIHTVYRAKTRRRNRRRK